MKRTEAKTMAAQMSNMELLSDFDYIHQGSGAYNSYQRTAIRDELDERPDAREMWMGTDGTHGRGRPEAQEGIHKASCTTSCAYAGIGAAVGH